MKLKMRLYQCEDDYWRIRGFLREAFLLDERQGVSWPVARLDYWRWHGIENCGHGRLDRDVFIWETGDGQIAAVLNREEPGDAFLQIHPGQRTPELEEEMVVVAEKHLSIPASDGRRKLRMWVSERDSLRQEILTRRGYARGGGAEYKWQRSLDEQIPDIQIAPGYTVRALGDTDELPARSWLSWRAFHPDEPDEKYEGWEWYRNIQRMPLYRRDLDIVAVAPNGDLAAFCTLWYDDVTRSGNFEPVGTAPEHQRRGLGKAVMGDAMRRARRLGATLVTVGGYRQAAKALYTSVVSPEYEMFESWEKELQAAGD